MNKFLNYETQYSDIPIIKLVQNHEIVISWKTEVLAPLKEIFIGREFEKIIAGIVKTHQQKLKSRVFIALHMHAGDGNVHANIPVNSDDYQMMSDAQTAVSRVMNLSKSLDHSISGDHGIGITKMQFLYDEMISL